MINVGVLSFQGDLEEHEAIMREALKKKNIRGEVRLVKTRDEVSSVDALIIPGGESTTICRLIDLYGVGEEIRRLALKGVPVMGTCAGMVVLSSSGCEEVKKTGQKLLNLIDCEVERNAFGRQRESFEADLDIPVLGKEKYHAVFIRAPSIKKAGRDVEVLSEYKGRIVAAQKNNVIVLAFHPELTCDTRMHEYFLSLLKR